jgi:hypothetical protein
VEHRVRLAIANSRGRREGGARDDARGPSRPLRLRGQVGEGREGGLYFDGGAEPSGGTSSGQGMLRSR